MNGTNLLVDLGKRSYEISIGRNLEATISKQLSILKDANKKSVIIVDQKVHEIQHSWLKKVFGNLPILVLRSGESTKGFASLELVQEFLISHHVDRGGVLWAVGGGVIGDLGGFAAATYLRGIEFYQVPTTLLAMVDSSVGGKTGINLKSGKNLVGAFHQPKGVFADMNLLKTLPVREFSAGMAEVIKVALLGDKELWNVLLTEDKMNPEHSELASVIERACALKAEIVSRDEKEHERSGGRALLNLGHTFGHAIENVAGYGEYLHGEAISIGMVLAARFSAIHSGNSYSVEKKLIDLLRKYQLPTTLRTYLPINELVEAMYRDKKVSSGRLRLVGILEPGIAEIVEEVSEEIILNLWQDLEPVNKIMPEGSIQKF